MPSVAYREYLEAPDGFIERVLESRHYAQAKARYDSAEKRIDAKDMTPLLEQVMTIDFELTREDLARRGR